MRRGVVNGPLAPAFDMRPMIPMQAGPEVIASRCEVASASRQNTFHQLATMAISRAIVRQLFSFCVANPDPHFCTKSRLFDRSSEFMSDKVPSRRALSKRGIVL